MNRTSLAPLAHAAAEALDQVGVTWRDLHEVAEGKRIVMPLLPYFTEVRLGTLQLQDFIDVKVGCGFEDFVVAYEGYLGCYIALRPALSGVDKEVRSALSLAPRDAKLLFGNIGSGRPSDAPRRRLLLTHSFAALALHNFGGTLKSTSTGFVVEVQRPDRTFSFGSLDGQALTNYGSGTIACGHKLFHPAGLAELRRSRGLAIRKPTLVALLWAWLEQAEALPAGVEKEALQLALQILYWRGNTRKHEALRASVREATGPQAWAPALEMAQRQVESEDAYHQLFMTFVPNLISKQEFVRLFGGRSRRGGSPSAPRRKLWAISLQYLNNKHLGEAA